MNFFRKIKQNVSSIITQTLMLLTIPWHLIAIIIYLIIKMLYLIFAVLFSTSGNTFIMILFTRFAKHLIIIKHYKKEAFPIYFKNPAYKYYLFFKDTVAVETGSIYSNYGRKIGSVVEKRLCTNKIKDIRKYMFTSRKVALLYVLMYPILRIISFLFSIIALFTDTFYVQISAPKDYDKRKYNEFLLCYFDVVYKRSDTKIAKPNSLTKTH